MSRPLLIVAALLAALFPGFARADSDVPSLASGTALTSAVMYLANAGATNTKLGFTASVFDISAAALTLKTGGISDAMLASTFLKINPALGNATGGTLSLSGDLTLSGLSTVTIAQCAGFATASNILGRGTCPGGGSSGLTIGTTTITSGTTGRVLYDNAGVLGEMTTTGSGTVLALATSPVLVTPNLGTPSALVLTNATGLPIAQIGASPASHAVPVDVAGTSTYKVIPDCTDTGGNHINYTQSTDAFSCGTSGSGGGSLTVTDGTNSVASTTTLTFGNGFLVGGSAGSATLNATNTINSQSGTGAYAILSTDAGKQIVRTNASGGADTITAASGAGFTSGFSTMYTTGSFAGNTVTPASGTIGGLAALKFGAYQSGSLDSDGTNYNVALSYPIPPDQTGSRLNLSDMKWTAAFTDGQIPVGQTGAEILPKTLSQDCTLAASGAITCLKTNNVSFGALATTTPGTGVATALGVNIGTAGAVLVKGTSVCADLSNGATGCSTATGTSGATIPLLNGTNTFSGPQTFGETHGTTYAPTLTSNNYNADTTDCGKTLLFPTGTTPTLTLPNLNAACTIVVVQNSATQFTVQAASGGSVVSVNSYTKSKAQNAILFLTIITPSASAAKWALAGDGA